MTCAVKNVVETESGSVSIQLHSPSAHSGVFWIGVPSSEMAPPTEVRAEHHPGPEK